jgi:hypothetical protein
MRASSRSSRIFWTEARVSQRSGRALNRGSALRLTLVFASTVGAADLARARGGGPPGWTMTLSYCRETVANKGITDVTKFEQEVKRCFANPVTYPPAYPKPTW